MPGSSAGGRSQSMGVHQTQIDKNEAYVHSQSATRQYKNNNNSQQAWVVARQASGPKLRLQVVNEPSRVGVALHDDSLDLGHAAVVHGGHDGGVHLGDADGNRLQRKRGLGAWRMTTE